MRKCDRRGLAVVEWCCILGFAAIIIIAAAGTFGPSLSGKVNNVSNMLVDDIGEEDQDEPSKEGGKGNNGLGNGEDPPPPGLPPVNDGEGTSPGNPGNRRLGV